MCLLLTLMEMGFDEASVLTSPCFKSCEIEEDAGVATGRLQSIIGVEKVENCKGVNSCWLFPVQSCLQQVVLVLRQPARLWSMHRLESRPTLLTFTQ